MAGSFFKSVLEKHNNLCYPFKGLSYIWRYTDGITRISDDREGKGSPGKKY